MNIIESINEEQEKKRKEEAEKLERQKARAKYRREGGGAFPWNKKPKHKK